MIGLVHLPPACSAKHFGKFHIDSCLLNLASNPAFLFQILSRSFGEKSEPRLSVPNFAFFSKAARQNPERKAWVQGYAKSPKMKKFKVICND